MTSFHDFTTAVLKQAVQIREEIESLQEKLHGLLGGTPSTTTKKKVGRPAGKRTISPEHRAKLAAAQKARWAKAKSPVAKKRKTMSAEARAKIAAAQKARWAAQKAAA